MSSSIIQHQGVVQGIENNHLEIMIISESACSSCKSKKICSISEAKEKLIYIESSDKSYRIGDEVIVFLEERMGAYAVVFAYGLPFIVMVLSLFIGYYNNASEPVMGLSVLASLSLYFGIVYLFRNQLGKKITFKVEKQINQTY
ncbi:MAG: RseC/MucC family positive regulator of sigma(E) [Bacteroidales bacterium]|nr:MAG: RseC/MucC family positive regulator of sigma(E) [Bacteroidales bacterium]